MKAIIEIPKGDTRRRHLKYDKSGFVDLGPIKDVIPVNDGVMPVHYGYIPETVNPAEKDEIDVLVFSDKGIEVGQEINIRPVALIRRADGDDKVVAVDETITNVDKWEDVDQREKDAILKFFGYHHDIISIDEAKLAEEYIRNNKIRQG